MDIILDACALIAFFRGESGSEKVGEFLSDSSYTCYAHVINLCEVYYDFLRVSDVATANLAMQDLQALGIISGSCALNPARSGR